MEAQTQVFSKDYASTQPHAAKVYFWGGFLYIFLVCFVSSHESARQGRGRRRRRERGRARRRWCRKEGRKEV